MLSLMSSLVGSEPFVERGDEYTLVSMYIFQDPLVR